MLPVITNVFLNSYRRLLLAPVPPYLQLSSLQPYSLTSPCLSVFPVTTLTLSYPSWVCLDYTCSCILLSCLEQTALPVLPHTGSQGHGSLGEALLSPPQFFQQESRHRLCSGYTEQSGVVTIFLYLTSRLLMERSLSCLHPLPPELPTHTQTNSLSLQGSKMSWGAYRLEEAFREQSRASVAFHFHTFPSKVCHLLPLITVPSCLA